MTVDDDAKQLKLGRLRVRVLEAVVAALDRREEVSDLVAGCEDFAEASTALARLLATDEVAARGVLTLHWSGFTRARHRQAVEDLAETRAMVEALERDGAERP